MISIITWRRTAFVAASFLKRKPKDPDRPQRREIPVLEADAASGLSAAQAQERLDGGWDNAPVESPGASVREIIAKNVFTYFNFLFFLLAGCVIAVRQWLNLTFLGPVFCNMFIGIVQDLRVKKKVDGLKIMAAPKCRAVRDGQTVMLDAAQLVRDRRPDPGGCRRRSRRMPRQRGTRHGRGR